MAIHRYLLIWMIMDQYGLSVPFFSLIFPNNYVLIKSNTNTGNHSVVTTLCRWSGESSYFGLNSESRETEGLFLNASQSSLCRLISTCLAFMCTARTKIIPYPNYPAYPVTARVVRAPKMTSQPVSFIFLFSTALLDLANSRLVHSLILSSSVSSSVCLVFFLLSPCLAKWFWPDLMSGRHPYHSSLRLLIMVRRSSCGQIACWILVWTSLLVTWSSYEMCSILR